jgi:O-antigen/teichoic acid export membrane protein
VVLLVQKLRKVVALFGKGFVQSVSVLAGGSLIGQVVMLVALPFLTRIYLPEDFSLFAVYTALLGLVSLVSCLRFDIAIPIPEKETDAINIAFLAIFSLISVVILISLLIFLLGEYLANALNQIRILPYLWLLPLSIFSAGIFNTLQSWATRQKYFPIIARTGIERTIVGTLTQLILGWAGKIESGLIFGMIANSIFGVARFAFQIFKLDGRLLKSISFSEMKRMAKEYNRFPKYSTFESLFNSTAVQLPLLLIASATFGAELGYLMLAIKVIQLPLGTLGAAVGQVYLSEAPSEWSYGNLGEFTAKIVGILARVCAAVLVFVCVVVPDNFTRIFGSDWSRAEDLVFWVLPWAVMQFLVSPVSMALHITNHQRRALILQSVGLVIRCGVVLVCGFTAPKYASEAYAISGFVFYFIYLLVVVITVEMKPNDLLCYKRQFVIIAMGSFFISLCVRAVLGYF